jgi:hypothetical protein
MARCACLLVVVLVAAACAAAATTTCTRDAAANRATVAGIADPRVGCAMFYTSTYAYLGAISFAAGATSSVTSPAYKSVPTQVELYSAGCTTYYAYYACNPVAAATATPATVTAAPSTAAPTIAYPTTNVMPTVAKPTVTSTVVPPAGYTGGAPIQLVRAMYSWGKADCLLGVGTNCPYATVADQQAAFFYRLQYPLRAYPAFNRVYLQMDGGLLTTASAQVQSLLAAAHARGIAVELLGGESAWMSTAAGPATPIAICNAVKVFNVQAPANARWDGIHWDLEPHTMPGWTTNTTGGTDPYNDAYEANLVNILRGCRAALAGTNITLAWDAATFYPRWATDVWGPVVAERLVDYVAFMAYAELRASVNDGKDVVPPLLAQLGGLGGAVIAADVSEPSLAPASDSFWAVGALPLENLLGSIGRTYGNLSSTGNGTPTHGFLGVAVHSLGNYVSLQPTGPPLAPRCTFKGRTIQLATNGVAVASVAIYNAQTWAYISAVTTLSRAANYTLTAARLVATGYVLELYDGANLTRAAVDSLIFDVSCTAAVS